MNQQIPFNLQNDCLDYLGPQAANLKAKKKRVDIKICKF